MYKLSDFGGMVVCVVYSINANCSSYANLKYMVKINFIKIELKYNRKMAGKVECE
jgi:hypothetical protein